MGKKKKKTIYSYEEDKRNSGVIVSFEEDQRREAEQKRQKEQQERQAAIQKEKQQKAKSEKLTKFYRETAAHEQNSRVDNTAPSTYAAKMMLDSHSSTEKENERRQKVNDYLDNLRKSRQEKQEASSFANWKAANKQPDTSYRKTYGKKTTELEDMLIQAGKKPKKETTQEQSAKRETYSGVDDYNTYLSKALKLQQEGAFDDDKNHMRWSNKGLETAKNRTQSQIDDIDSNLESLKTKQKNKEEWNPRNAHNGWANLYEELKDGRIRNGRDLLSYIDDDKNIMARASQYKPAGEIQDDEESARRAGERAFNYVFGYSDENSGMYDLVTEGMSEAEKANFDKKLASIIGGMQNPYRDFNYDAEAGKLTDQRDKLTGELGKWTGELDRRQTIADFEANAPDATGIPDPEKKYLTGGNNVMQFIVNSATGPQGDDMDKTFWAIRDQKSKWNSMTTAEKIDMLNQLTGSNSHDGLAESLQDTTKAYGQYYAFMTDEQVDTFEKYYKTGDKDSARAYMEALRPYLQMYANEYSKAVAEEAATGDYGWFYGLKSIADAPMKAMVSAMGTTLAFLGNEEAGSANSTWFRGQNIQNATRGGRREAWGRTAERLLGSWAKAPAEFLNGVFYSMADMAVATGIGGALSTTSEISEPLVQFVMSSEAASNTMTEQLERGIDPREAALYAVGSGTIEWITEKYSIEQLLKPNVMEMLGNKKQLAKFIAKNFIAEGSEEGASSVLEIGLDALLSAVNGHETEIQERINQLKGQMGEKAATRLVLLDQLKQTGMEMLAGGVSGLMKASARVGATKIDQKSTGQQIRTAETSGSNGTDVIIDAALNMKEDMQSRKQAEELAEKREKGKDITDIELGRLAQNLQHETTGIVAKTARTVVEDRAYDKLADSDMDDTQRRGMAQIISNAVTNGVESLTKQERSVILASEEGFSVLKEFTMPTETSMATVGEIMDKTRGEAEIQQSVSELLHKDIRQQNKNMEDTGEQLATEEDISRAEGKRTGGVREVIVDGKFETLGNLVTVKEKDTDGKETTKLMWEIAGTDRRVDASQVKATDFTTAAIVRQAAINPNMFSNGFTNTLLAANDKGEIKNAGRFLMEAQRVRIAAYIGQHMPMTTMTRTTAQEIYDQAKWEHGKNRENDLKGGNADGKHTITFQGAEYGTKEFNDKINQIVDPAYRAQIDAIAGIAQRAKISVTFRSAAEVAAIQGVTDAEKYYGWEKGATRDENGNVTDSGGITVNVEGLDFMLGEDGKPAVKGAHNMLVTFGHEMTHWLQRNSMDGYNQLESFVLKEMGKNGVNVSRRVMEVMNNRDLSVEDAISEIVADSCDQILANESVRDHIQETNQGLFKEIKHFVTDLVGRVKDAMKGMRESQSRDSRAMLRSTNELARIWLGAYDEAISGEIRRIDGTGKGKERASVAGVDKATLRTLYISNYAPNTPRAIKSQRIIDLVQNVWSKTPITLKVYDNNSNGRYIEAQFDPDFDPTGARQTDIGKLAFGNNMGSKPERRATMNLADDYHHILKNAKYATFELERKNHPGVKRWFYFINDIYYAEQGSDEAIPYRIEIDVKEKEDGNYVYTYYAREDKTAQRKKLSLMDLAPVNTGVMSGESASASANNVPQNKQAGKTRNSRAELDTDYMQAVKDGDEQRQQALVDQAAKDNGYTMKVYHGTPYGGFTRFRDWSYFTQNKDYADRYNHPSQSSTRGRYDAATKPMTYGLYMNPGRVLDTRQPEARKLFNQIRMELGMSELTERGLPDWTDGRDLIDYVEENDLPYDTIILDEGADGGYGAPVIPRGESYVTRSNMVKSADPVTYDDNGKAIPLSERFNRENNDIRFSRAELDNEYLKAYENNDEQRMREIIEQAAYQAGYTDKAYHGTELFGFTKFDLDASQDAVFVSYGSKLASSYTQTNKIKAIADRKGIPTNFYTLSNKDLIKFAKPLLTDKYTEYISIEPINDENGKNDQDEFIVKRRDRIRDKIEEFKARRFELYNWLNSALNQNGEYFGIYELFTKPGNQLVIDAKHRAWNEIPFDTREMKVDAFGNEYYEDDESMDPEPMATTREIAAWAKKHGYDSVRINNVLDNGGRNYNVGYEDSEGDIGIFFNPNDVKSADTITTTDTDWKPILPSERFNSENEDIRFSMAELDTDYMQAVKDGDEQRQQALVDQAAEKAFRGSKIRTKDGKLRRVYHGTNSGRFTVFDRDLIGTAREGDTGFFGEGFYFAYNKGEAQMYGRDVIDAYLDIRNPFDFQKELNTYNGERSYDYNGGRAAFIVNWARKFPELAKFETIAYAEPGSDEIKSMSMEQFADEFEKIYREKEFTIQPEERDGQTEWRALADLHEESYTDSDGKVHKWKEYDFQKRFYSEEDARNRINLTYEYMAEKMYSYLRLPASATIVMSSNLTESLKQRGYDGVIQSEDGDEIVAFEESQIKSADPITRDDNGNVIPPSERFNRENNDIRYSTAEAEKTLEDSGEIAAEPVRYSYAGITSGGGYAAYVAEAGRMEKEGVPDEEITRKTGCVRGFNGRWWKVLDHDKMQFMPDKVDLKESTAYKLGNIYDAQELYEAYPTLKNAYVRFKEFNNGTLGAHYGSKYAPMIEINRQLLDDDHSQDVVEKVLQHEIQHAIQAIEGSNSGSNVTFWKDMQDIAQARVRMNDGFLKAILDKAGLNPETDLAFGIEFNEDGTVDEEWLFPEELEKVKKMSEEDLQMYRKTVEDSEKWMKLLKGYKSPRTLYLNTVGEIEARAAENRYGADQYKPIDYRDAITTEEYTGKEVRLSKYTSDNMDVEEWLTRTKPWNVQTEDERALLDKYGGLRTRRGLLTKTVLELKANIKRKEENLAKLTPDEVKELERMREKLEEKQQKLAETEDELFRVTSGEGYGRMMYQNNVVLNDFILGKTQDDVREAVEQMVDAVKVTEKEIQRQVKAMEKLAESTAVKAVSSMIEKKSLNYAVTSLKKQLNSGMGKTELESRLTEMALKRANGEDITEDARLLAIDMTNQMRGYQLDVMERMRGIRIVIGPDQQAEMKGNGMTLAGVRERLKGTGIKVEFGDRSTLDTDTQEGGDLRTLLPELPQEISENSADALFRFIDWAEDMRDKELQAKQSMVDIEDETMNVLAIAGTIKVNLNSPEYRAQNEKAAKIRQLAEDMKQSGKQMSENTDLAGRRAVGFASILQRDVYKAIEYYNKVARVAAQEEKNKVRKNIIEQLKSQHTVDLINQRQKYEDLMKNDRKARALAEDNLQLRNRINTVASRIRKRLMDETDIKNIPEEAKPLARQVLKMLVQHDYIGYRHVLFTDKQKREQVMAALTSWDRRDGMFDANKDLDWLIVGSGENQDTEMMERAAQCLTDIESGLLEYRTAEGQKNITLMERKEALKKIDNAVTDIWLMIDARARAEINGRRMMVEEIALQAQGDMKNSRFKGENTGIIGHGIKAAKSAVFYGNMTPEYFFKMLRNKTLSGLYEEYHRAENKYGLLAQKATDRIAEIAEKYGYREWDQDKTYTFQLEKGGTVELTLGEMMSLYATWQREIMNQAELNGPEHSFHLEVGGFVTEAKEKHRINGREYLQQRAHRVTQEDINRIESRMTDAQRQYLDEMVRYITKEVGELGNEASMRMYGIKKFKEQYYFPMKVWSGVLSKKSDAGAAPRADNRVAHGSQTKRRKANANNALLIRDFTKVICEHCETQLRYNTFAPAIEFMQRTLNQSMKVETGDPEAYTKRTLRAAFEEIYGTEAAKYLARFQDDINGGVNRSDVTVYDKLLSTFKKSAVAGSVSVAAQQPLSYIRAAMMINPKYLATSVKFNPAAIKRVGEEMRKYSGVAVIKKIGKFDMNFGRSSIDYMTPEAKTGKGKQIYDKASEFATKLPDIMDTWTWCNMWEAVKKEQAAQNPGMSRDSDEFLNKVAERFNDVMRKTQVYDSVLVKSQNMRSTNPFMKSLTSFMAEPTLTLNVLADAVGEAKAGDRGGKTKLAKAATTFLMSAVLQALVKGLIGAGRNPQDKKTWDENVAYRFTSNLLNEINPIGLIPGYNDLITLLKKGELADDAMGVVGKMIDALKTGKNWVTGESKNPWYRDLEDSVGVVAQLFTNIPAKNISRDVRAVMNYITAPWANRANSKAVLEYQFKDLFFNADNMLGVINTWAEDSGWGTKNTAYYSRIYAADKAGKQQKVNDMIEYLKLARNTKQETINTGIRGLVKQDSRLTEQQKLDWQKKYGLKDGSSYITGEYKDGNIDRKTAEAMYRKENPGKEDKKVWETFDRIDYAKAGKLEDGESYSSYNLLYDAIESGNQAEIRGAVKKMLSYGYKKENIKSQLTKKYKQDYIDATVDGRRKMQNKLVRAYTEIGVSAAEAAKIMQKWVLDENKKKNNGKK